MSAILDTRKLESLIEHVTRQDGGVLFYSFSNQDGKYWLMPAKNLRTAMNLYQPVSIKGKLMKLFFPLLKELAFVRNQLRVDRKRSELREELSGLVKRIFHTDHLEFSLFGGTPSAHQKITIQLSSGQTILGYCKVSDQAAVKQVFRHEQQVLDELKNKGVRQIPECLYCGELTEEIAVFVQTTLKTNASKTPTKWSNRHEAFLKDLHEKTRQTIGFEQTDFCSMLEELPSKTGLLSQADVATIASAIEKLSRHYSGKTVVFSAFHADFTPWNMFVEQGRLFVFDFEYAQMTYPPYLDWFHFFTQTGIFEKHLDAGQLFSAYQQQKQAIENYFDNPDFSYQCYLLSVIALYLNREKEHPAPAIMSMLKTWVSLLSFFRHETEK